MSNLKNCHFNFERGQIEQTARDYIETQYTPGLPIDFQQRAKHEFCRHMQNLTQHHNVFDNMDCVQLLAIAFLLGLCITGNDDERNPHGGK